MIIIWNPSFSSGPIWQLYSCTDGERVIIWIVHQLQKQYDSESHFCTLYRPLNSQHRQIPTCLQGLQKLEIKKASKVIATPCTTYPDWLPKSSIFTVQLQQFSDWCMFFCSASRRMTSRFVFIIPAVLKIVKMIFASGDAL